MRLLITRSWKIILIFLTFSCDHPPPLLLAPVGLTDRAKITDLQLTEIGEFGLERIARPGIPAHLHTGIDIMRPDGNYTDSPIFPIAPGVVISKRTDGPYAQLIIEHTINSQTFWTVYEHIAAIRVGINQQVEADDELARFFNKQELDSLGWQFDHFHFEVLKKQPGKKHPNEATPERHFQSYTLDCFTEASLLRYFYDPLPFLKTETL